MESLWKHVHNPTKVGKILPNETLSLIKVNADDTVSYKT